MNEVETLRILRKVREGDESAFQELYNHWSRSIYKFAWQMTGSTSMAEDITQDVFLLIIRNDLHFNPLKGAFSSFLYGVARNLSLRAMRKNQRFFGILEMFESQRQSQNVVNPLVELTTSESTINLRKCILSLPSQYREVVILCDLHERTYEEAAEITRSAIGTVRSRLHRGRELLLQKMRSAGQSPNPKKGGALHEIPAL
jgi:RNA polymerase sigma-70 factor, ECF subfamily